MLEGKRGNWEIQEVIETITNLIKLFGSKKLLTLFSCLATQFRTRLLFTLLPNKSNNILMIRQLIAQCLEDELQSLLIQF